MIARKDLPAGRYLEVIPLTFGRARLIIGRVEDKISYDDSW
jgi:hypothetical protein